MSEPITERDWDSILTTLQDRGEERHCEQLIALRKLADAAEKDMAERFLWDCDTREVSNDELITMDEWEMALYIAIQEYCGYPLPATEEQ